MAESENKNKNMGMGNEKKDENNTSGNRTGGVYAGNERQGQGMPPSSPGLASQGQKRFPDTGGRTGSANQMGNPKGGPGRNVEEVSHKGAENEEEDVNETKEGEGSNIEE